MNLFVRAGSGMVFSTSDWEHWQRAASIEPPDPPASPTFPLPEPGASVRDGHPNLYAAARNAWKSEDGGRHWENLTAWKGGSLLGGNLLDLAVSPVNPEELTVVGSSGVWRSVDGGSSWSGINQNLPNLPARRIEALPKDGQPVQLELLDGELAEWKPGASGWQTGSRDAQAANIRRRQALSLRLSREITAAAGQGETIYAGTATGSIFSSFDGGRTWQESSGTNSNGAIESLFVDPHDTRFAWAAASGSAGRVLRTATGGRIWDDLSGSLPAGEAWGVAADLASGAVYAATRQGVFYLPAAAGEWTPLRSGLPEASALDVRLDAEGNQLYVLLEGYGVYATLAPHRNRQPRLVSAADWMNRPAAPGGLMSVLGAGVESAVSGEAPLPVLSASPAESQVQIPFAVEGNRIPIRLRAGGRDLSFDVPLRPAAPAIFVDRSGVPLLLDGDSGLMLDASAPARSGSRLQILATGLGKVTPDWPAGLPAPAENAPKVAGRTSVFLDRQAIPVSRAILAPGYVGMYLLEVQIPRLVNAGSAELYIEVEGVPSNRVRLVVEP